MPPSDDRNCPPPTAADDEKIMRISLPISKETILMGSDNCEVFGQATTMGDNIALSINNHRTDEADRFFGRLSTDWRIDMPIKKSFGALTLGCLPISSGFIGWYVMMRFRNKNLNGTSTRYVRMYRVFI